MTDLLFYRLLCGARAFLVPGKWGSGSSTLESKDISFDVPCMNLFSRTVVAMATRGNSKKLMTLTSSMAQSEKTIVEVHYLYMNVLYLVKISGKFVLLNA